jgi:glutamyl-tRNA synthetase
MTAKNIKSAIRTRFAPSPTGFLHIGGLRTALYAFALAKHEKGNFILRVEDTDQKREVEGATEALKKTLDKFGLHWDEFYKQSERQKEGMYETAAKKLVSEGHAFYCQCKAKNAKEEGYSTNLRDICRDKNLTNGAIKLKVPEGKKLSYYDFVHKKDISWDSDTVYDATLLKSDGFPTYHLAVAVDDLDLKISHILRGHDWLPSTPIHLLVFDFLGGKMPEIGHLTDILSGETGKKLSKRRDSVFVENFIEEGYLPEALLNFVMLLGWAPKDNRELFTLEEFVDHFDIQGFQEANPKFFRNKLDWFNQHYIMQSQIPDLRSQIFKFFGGRYSEDQIEKVLPLVQTRIKTLKEFENMVGFFFEKPKIDHQLLGNNYKHHLSLASKVLGQIKDWSLETINQQLMNLVKEKDFKTGDFFMDLRIAITGKKFTPPINDSIVILGKEETLERLRSCLEIDN